MSLYIPPPGLLALRDDAARPGLAWAERCMSEAARLSVRGAPSPSAVHISDCGSGRRPYAVLNGVAEIHVQGFIVPRFEWIGWEWVTGCDALRYQFAMACADPDVRGIAMRYDTGGGYCQGINALAEWMVAARAASGKPVMGLLDEHAYSAGYWLASCADVIVVPETGGLGSIGVIAAHWDISGYLENEGVKVTIVRAGAKKALGDEYSPLPPEVQGRMQAQFEDFRSLFAGTVARNRTAALTKLGRGALDTKAVLATEGDTWDGPAETARAVELGYADIVVTDPDEALEAFVRDVNQRSAA